MLGAVATALVVSADAAAENLLPLGPPTMGGRNAGCQVIPSAEAQAALGRKTVIGQYDAGNLFICNLATGKIAGMIETMDGYSFWAMHAGIIAAGAVLLVVFAVLFNKLLAPKAEDKPPADADPQPAPA